MWSQLLTCIEAGMDALYSPEMGFRDLTTLYAVKKSLDEKRVVHISEFG